MSRSAREAALDIISRERRGACPCRVSLRKGVDIDRYRRVVAICSVGGVDVAEWIVRAGLAFDWPRYSKGKYAGAQKEAERADRGVWAGSYVVPWDYRACRPNQCAVEVRWIRTGKRNFRLPA